MADDAPEIGDIPVETEPLIIEEEITTCQYLKNRVVTSFENLYSAMGEYIFYLFFQSNK